LWWVQSPVQPPRWRTTPINCPQLLILLICGYSLHLNAVSWSWTWTTVPRVKEPHHHYECPSVDKIPKTKLDTPSPTDAAKMDLMVHTSARTCVIWDAVHTRLDQKVRWMIEWSNSYFHVNPLHVLPYGAHTNTCSSAPATAGNISGSLLSESPTEVMRCCDVTHRIFWSILIFQRPANKVRLRTVGVIFAIDRSCVSRVCVLAYRCVTAWLYLHIQRAGCFRISFRPAIYIVQTDKHSGVQAAPVYSMHIYIYIYIYAYSIYICIFWLLLFGGGF
jgi:hypothetical protein